MQDKSIPFGAIPVPEAFLRLSPWEQWLFLREQLKNGPRDHKFRRCWDSFFSNNKRQIVFVPRTNIIPLEGDEIYYKTEEKHLAEQAVIDDILLFHDAEDDTGTIFEQLQLFPDKYEDEDTLADRISFLQEELCIWRKLFFEYYKNIPEQIRFSALAQVERNYEKIEKAITHTSYQRLNHAFGSEGKRSAWLQKQFAHGYEVALLVLSFIDDDDCYKNKVDENKVFGIEKAIRKTKKILEGNKRSLRKSSESSMQKPLHDMRTLQKHFTLWFVCNYLYTFYHFETVERDDCIECISLKFWEHFFAQGPVFDEFKMINKINYNFCLSARPYTNKINHFLDIFFDFINWHKSPGIQSQSKIDSAIQSQNSLLHTYLSKENTEKHLKIFLGNQLKHPLRRSNVEYCMRLGIGKHILEQGQRSFLPPKENSEIAAMLFNIAKEQPGELLFVVTTIVERFLVVHQSIDTPGIFSWMKEILDIDPRTVKFGNQLRELNDFKKLMNRLGELVLSWEKEPYLSWIKRCE